MTIVRTKTPSGEAIVILPEAAFDHLVALAEETRDTRTLAGSQARLAAGADEILSEADLDDLRRAPSPLAFWRGRRGLTTADLAGLGGVSDTVLTEMERGERGGDIVVYRRLAEALGVNIDDLLPHDAA